MTPPVLHHATQKTQFPLHQSFVTQSDLANFCKHLECEVQIQQLFCMLFHSLPYFLLIPFVLFAYFFHQSVTATALLSPSVSPSIPHRRGTSMSHQTMRTLENLHMPEDSRGYWKHLDIHVEVPHLHNGTFLPAAVSLAGQHRDLHPQQPL